MRTDIEFRSTKETIRLRASLPKSVLLTKNTVKH